MTDLTFRDAADFRDADELDAVRSALVADVLHRDEPSLPGNRRVRLRVHGESMLPALWPGDTVEIAACSIKQLKVGDIVLAIRDGRLFLHRLLSRRNSSGFVLGGDSTPALDPPFPRKHCSAV